MAKAKKVPVKTTGAPRNKSVMLGNELQVQFSPAEITEIGRAAANFLPPPKYEITTSAPQPVENSKMEGTPVPEVSGKTSLIDSRLIELSETLNRIDISVANISEIRCKITGDKPYQSVGINMNGNGNTLSQLSVLNEVASYLSGLLREEITQLKDLV